MGTAVQYYNYPIHKDKPSEDDVKVVTLLGRGLTMLQVSRRMGVTEYAIIQRLKRLYYLTGTRSKNHLLWWMMDQEYVEYPLSWDRKPRPTDQQLEVLRLLAHGSTFAAIGRQFHMSTRGVHKWVQVATKNTKCINTTHLIAVCMEKGWIE